MAKLPRVTPKQIIKVLQKKGFSLARQSGSHQIYIDSAGKRTTAPYHAGKTLHPKVLKNILSDAELGADELIRLL